MTIRKQIALPLCAIALLLLVGGYVGVKQLLDSLERSFTQTTLNSKVEDAQQSIAKMSSNALQQAALFSRMPSVVEAYKVAALGDMNDENDPKLQEAREMLRASLADVLKGYKENVGSSFRVHFHLPTARSLARMWRDKQARRDGQWVDVSDDLSSFRRSVIDVNASRRPVKGIEPGRGGFTIRGLAPIMDADGVHLGSVEVLIGFKGLLETIESNGRISTLLYMNSDLLPITTRLQNSDDYPVRDGEFVLVYGKDNVKARELASTEFLARGLRENVFFMEDHEALSAFPVLDYKGESIGTLVFSLASESQQAMMINIMSAVAAGLLFILLAPLLITMGVLQRSVIKPIRACADQATSIAGGDLTAVNDFTRDDEMGVVMKAMNDMSGKLTDTIGNVQIVSGDVAHGCEEFADACRSLSHGSAQQTQGLHDVSRAWRKCPPASSRRRPSPLKPRPSPTSPRPTRRKAARPWNAPWTPCAASRTRSASSKR